MNPETTADIIKRTEKVVVVLSGGMDSTTLLHYVTHVVRPQSEVYAITYNYGQRHTLEIEMAKWQCAQVGVKEHKILDISFMRELLKGSSALMDSNIKVPHIKDVVGDAQPITYVPNRNTILLSIAVAWAEARGAYEVYYGAQAHDSYSGYWDASKEYLPAINAVFNLNRKNKIQIVAPFMNQKKDELLNLGFGMNIDYSKTMTCYNGTNPSCGTCPTCADRIQAFRKVKRIDPMPYVNVPPWGQWGCK